MKRAPQKMTFWWDFSQPGEMPLKLECNHPALPDVLATFDGDDAVDRAHLASELALNADIHPRMKPDRILARILSAIAETRPETTALQGE